MSTVDTSPAALRALADWLSRPRPNFGLNLDEMAEALRAVAAEKAAELETTKEVLLSCINALADRVAAEKKAQAVPQGWKLVPVEPTEEMHVAAVKTIVRCTGNADFPPRVYRDMLAAAPKAPEVSPWQPIETAPKDGRVLIRWVEDEQEHFASAHRVQIGHGTIPNYSAAVWEYFGCDWGVPEQEVLGWMPLPAGSKP